MVETGKAQAALTAFFLLWFNSAAFKGSPVRL